MNPVTAPPSSVSVPENEEAARESGRRFGQAVGARASQRMLGRDVRPDQIPAVGAEEVASVLAHADDMVAAGVERSIVAAWTEAAAGAFAAEMERAVAFLLAHEASPSRH